MRTPAESVAGVACAGCDRPLETCAFCEQEGCPSPSCYGCLVVDLRESLAQPHEHGG
jgi:hypothetical protein